MAKKDDWEGFASTGNVMDYLQYKGCMDRMTNLSDFTSGLSTAGNVPFSLENDRREHERFDHTDRDGTSIVTDERI